MVLYFHGVGKFVNTYQGRSPALCCYLGQGEEAAMMLEPHCQAHEAMMEYNPDNQFCFCVKVDLLHDNDCCYKTYLFPKEGPYRSGQMMEPTICPDIQSFMQQSWIQYCFHCGDADLQGVAVVGGVFRLKTCSGCKYAYYCDKKCQTAHWRDCHKRQCKLIKRALASGKAQSH